MKRNYHFDVQLKIEIDGGGKFLKLCLNFISINNDNLGTQFKDSEVKKFFIIGIVPDIPENYNNVAQLWNLLKLNRIMEIFSSYVTGASVLPI